MTSLVTQAIAQGWITPAPSPTRLLYRHPLRKPNRPSKKECRMLNICITCRVNPAISYPGNGHGVKCVQGIAVRKGWCGEAKS